MILIADSGSTKTSWVLTGKDQKRLEFQSQGFNPYVQTKEQIAKALEDEVLPWAKAYDITKIYFYGAGCSSEENRLLMYQCFRDCFKTSEIEVEHDLIGAARALWFDDEGIVAILGTGSNSCLYDGKTIIDNIPSLGFILGDEGSGAYMGKILLRDYLYRKMPEALNEAIFKRYNLNSQTILEHIYKMENPNRWLASFAPFISENMQDEYCLGIVLKSFKDFFEMHLTQYPGYETLPLGVIGSIGFYFREQLETVSKQYGVHLKKVIKSPIDELVRYHLTREEK